VRRVRVLAAAQAEYQATAVHYETERSGFGLRFREEFDGAIARAREFPAAAARIPEASAGVELRSLVLPGFPVKIIYAVEPEAVVVVAVFHARRRPSYWRKRLRPR
jgi:toxin ParE1/3/4